MNTFKENIKILTFFFLVFSIGLFSGFFIKKSQSISHDISKNTSQSTATKAEESVERYHEHSRENHLHLAKNSIEPTVLVTAKKDMMGGFNIHVKTTDFTWTPEKVGEKVEEATGHAHVYVNNIKVGRLYGPWMYVPEKYFTPGENEIKVTLNV